MSSSNTQDKKTIISSNFSQFNLIGNEDRRKLKEAQMIQQDDVPGVNEEQNPEKAAIISSFLESNPTADPETVGSAWELLQLMRDNAELSIYDQNALRVAADMVDAGF